MGKNEFDDFIEQKFKFKKVTFVTNQNNYFYICKLHVYNNSGFYIPK